MRLEYDPQADAIYLRLKKGRVHETIEISDGVLVDLDEKGDPLGIEVLFVSKRYRAKDLASLSVRLLTSKTSK
ncbi:MAG: DUF2283 domain-containing protein [Armatimonadetes bacterium]|nr:DUF2283 domain-containing protein [Armatimonadota bacterium]MDW8028182.1 DUF2283 domain-containing protein [Armatimonadota bacterium]